MCFGDFSARHWQASGSESSCSLGISAAVCTGGASLGKGSGQTRCSFISSSCCSSFSSTLQRLVLGSETGMTNNHIKHICYYHVLSTTLSKLIWDKIQNIRNIRFYSSLYKVTQLVKVQTDQSETKFIFNTEYTKQAFHLFVKLLVCVNWITYTYHLYLYTLTDHCIKNTILIRGNTVVLN